MMREAFHLIVLLSLIATSIAAAQGEDHSSVRIERKSCQAPDGVTIVYSAGGAGKTALVLIHGGLADRTFFDEQLRAINGDLFPTDVVSARKVKADFDVVVMEHTGHYPMLERPDEFNRHVEGIVQELIRRTRNP